MYSGFVLDIYLDCVGDGGGGCSGEGDFFTLYPLFPPCLGLLHFGVPLPAPPPSSLPSFCAPLQPKHPSKRRRGLASVWSARGGNVCTQCLPSWANSFAAAVWAKPGALVVTNAPLQEQVRSREMSDSCPVPIRPQTFCCDFYGGNTMKNTIQPSYNLLLRLANQQTLKLRPLGWAWTYVPVCYPATLCLHGFHSLAE